MPWKCTVSARNNAPEIGMYQFALHTRKHVIKRYRNSLLFSQLFFQSKVIAVWVTHHNRLMCSVHTYAIKLLQYRVFLLYFSHRSPFRRKLRCYWKSVEVKDYIDKDANESMWLELRSNLYGAVVTWSPLHVVNREEWCQKRNIASFSMNIVRSILFTHIARFDRFSLVQYAWPGSMCRASISSPLGEVHSNVSVCHIDLIIYIFYSSIFSNCIVPK